MLDLKTWAVVGATEHRDKFGYKIMKALKDKGYDVIPVNPGYETVMDIKCYKTVFDIPYNVDCVDVVVSPQRALNVIDECLEKGIKYIWFQPGTYDDQVIEKALTSGLLTVYDHCVLVELRTRG
jgi:predicted CoA-binding protein